MKYFIAKSEKIEDDFILRDSRVVIADNEDHAKSEYEQLNGTCNENQSLLCTPVEDGSVAIVMPTEKFKIQYPSSSKGVAVRCVKNSKIYTGILVAQIPAMVCLKEEEILEFMYRGNIEKYNEAILEAESNDKVRLSLRRLRQAIPYDRIVLDTGYKNLIIPLTADYVVEI